MDADLELEDGPTLVVPPTEMAVLAARTARTTSRRAAWSGYPPADAPARHGHHEEPSMRWAVIGIWTLAAFLFATLGMLVK